MIFLFFVATTIVALSAFYVILRKSKLIYYRKQNDKGERWATKKKPIIGGIGFFITFIFSVLFYTSLIDSTIISNSFFLIVIATSTIGFGMGLIDDLKGSAPRYKFVLQIMIAILLIITKNNITAFNSNWLNYPITVFWVVSLMNSINMLDNMDAITTSVSSIIVASLIGIELYLTGNVSFISYVCLGVTIALLSFLRWNWNPSKMYMGDNGSQFLGAFIAVISIKVIWNKHMASSITDFPIQQIIGIIFVFIAMISDTATVTINRLRASKSPLVGGRDHTTHHLSYLGLSERQVALVFIGVTILSNGIAFYILCIAKEFSNLQVAFWSFIALCIFSGFYSTTIFRKQKIC